MIREVASVYRASKKRDDINWFTEWVCRPPAAFIVWAVAHTRTTPNQLTLLSLVACAAACGVWLAAPGHLGAVLGVAVFEVSFVLDCADGQLARYRKTTSAAGHFLDFLMDELKALLVLGTLATRQWLATDDPTWLLVGVVGTAALGAGLAMTTFLRRSELGAGGPTSEGQPHRRRRGARGALEAVARWFIHYPQYIWIAAALDRLDAFVWVYAGIHVLYAGYALLGIGLRFGRFPPARS